jgi:hypothetical protein
MKISSFNDNLDKQSFVDGVDSQYSRLSAIQNLVLGKELDLQKDIPLLREIKCVNDFFEEPLDSPKATSLKKIVAMAIIAGSEKGILPFDLPNTNPETIAAIVDTGLTHAKISYLVAKGSLDLIEAMDKLIDMTASRTIAVLDKVIDKHLPIVISVIRQTIERVFPPAKIICPVIEQFIYKAKPIIKEAVHKGVRIISINAKVLVKEAAKSIAKVGRKVLDWLKN